MNKEKNALKCIALAMSSTKKWDATLVNRIAEILSGAGIELQRTKEPLPPPAACPKCKSSTGLQIYYTATCTHEYDAVNHTADESYEREFYDDPDNYHAFCPSCMLNGSLEEFGMALLGWTDEEGDDEE